MDLSAEWIDQEYKGQLQHTFKIVPTHPSTSHSVAFPKSYGRKGECSPFRNKEESLARRHIHPWTPQAVRSCSLRYSQRMLHHYPRSRTDPLVGCGRHFGRTIRSFCRIQPLIKNGMSRTIQLELERITEADLSPRWEITSFVHTPTNN